MFHQVLSFGEYRDYLRELLFRFKYQGDERLKTPLGKLMAFKILLWLEYYREREGLASYLSYLFLEAAPFDVVTSVPLHRDRFLSRGYNQSELLARVVAEELNLPYQELVTRNRATPPLSKQDKAERRDLIQGAFSQSDFTKNTKNTKNTKKGIEGRWRILLIDDIFTTGATITEVSSLLQRKGAEVFVLVLAR